MQEEPYIISKKRTVRKVYKGRIVAIVLVLCLAVIGGAIWFSRTSGKIGVAAREYRFVSVGNFSSLADASARADSVARSGGAGYILGNDEYRVMAACYTSKEDAETVCARLASEGEEAVVYTAKRPAISVEKPEKNSSLAATLLAYPDTVFDTLYEISVKLDTKEISAPAAEYGLLKLSVTASERQNECAALGGSFGERMGEFIGRLSAALYKLCESDENTMQAVKYTLCEIADTICSFDVKNLA